MLRGHDLITGKTCYFTAMTANDAEHFATMLADDAMWQVLPDWRYRHMSPAEWYSASIAKLDYPMAIREAETQAIVGVIGLSDVHGHSRHASLCLMMTTPDWDATIAREALQLMMQYTFLELNLNRLYCTVPDYHRGLIEAVSGAGWVLEGRFRENCFFDGGLHDSLLYGVLKSDWLE